MQQEISITYIIPSLGSGGAENQTIIQARELIKRGISCQIIVLSDNLELQNEIPKTVNCTFIRLKGDGTLSLAFIKKIFDKRGLIKKAIMAFDPTHIIAVLPAAFFSTP